MKSQSTASIARSEPPLPRAPHDSPQCHCNNKRRKQVNEKKREREREKKNNENETVNGSPARSNRAKKVLLRDVRKQVFGIGADKPAT
jgi:hypothetical protein